MIREISVKVGDSLLWKEIGGNGKDSLFWFDVWRNGENALYADLISSTPISRLNTRVSVWEINGIRDLIGNNNYFDIISEIPPKEKYQSE